MSNNRTNIGAPPNTSVLGTMNWRFLSNDALNHDPMTYKTTSTKFTKDGLILPQASLRQHNQRRTETKITQQSMLIDTARNVSALNNEHKMDDSMTQSLVVTINDDDSNIVSSQQLPMTSNQSNDKFHELSTVKDTGAIHIPLDMIVKALAATQNMSIRKATNLLYARKVNLQKSLEDDADNVHVQSSLQLPGTLIPQESSQDDDEPIYSTTNAAYSIDWLSDSDLKPDRESEDECEEDNDGSKEQRIIWKQYSRLTPIVNIPPTLKSLFMQDVDDRNTDMNSLDALYEQDTFNSHNSVYMITDDNNNNKNNNTNKDDTFTTSPSQQCLQKSQITKLRNEMQNKNVNTALTTLRKSRPIIPKHEKDALERVARRREYGVWHVPASLWSNRAKVNDTLSPTSADGVGIGVGSSSSEQGSNNNNNNNNNNDTVIGSISVGGGVNKAGMLHLSNIQMGTSSHYLNTHQVSQDLDSQLDFEVTRFEPGMKLKDVYEPYRKKTSYLNDNTQSTIPSHRGVSNYNYPMSTSTSNSNSKSARDRPSQGFNNNNLSNTSVSSSRTPVPTPRSGRQHVDMSASIQQRKAGNTGKLNTTRGMGISMTEHHENMEEIPLSLPIQKTSQ